MEEHIINREKGVHWKRDIISVRICCFMLHSLLNAFLSCLLVSWMFCSVLSFSHIPSPPLNEVWLKYHLTPSSYSFSLLLLLMSCIFYPSLLWWVFDTSFQTTYIFLPLCPGYREGFLWKRGRDNGQFLSRKFILSEREGALKYFNKQDVSKTMQMILHCVYVERISLWPVLLINMGLLHRTICCLHPPPSRPGIPKWWWKSRLSMPPSNRPRSATPAACRSPTWKTTAQGTSLSTTVMLRYTITMIFILIHTFQFNYCTLVFLSFLHFKGMFLICPIS